MLKFSRAHRFVQKSSKLTDSKVPQRMATLILTETLESYKIKYPQQINVTESEVNPHTITYRF